MICEWCGATVSADEGPCPKSFECPTCYAKPGSPCMRPSGHRADRLHADRLALAGLDSKGFVREETG